MPYRIDEPPKRPCPHGWYYGTSDAIGELLTGQRRTGCPRCAKATAREYRKEQLEIRAKQSGRTLDAQWRVDLLKNAVGTIVAVAAFIIIAALLHHS